MQKTEKEMNTYQIFRTFLEERGWTNDFDIAFENQLPGYVLDATLWDIMGGDEFFLARAFDWVLAPQGRDFWVKVDREWYKLYTNLKARV